MTSHKFVPSFKYHHHRLIWLFPLPPWSIHNFFSQRLELRDCCHPSKLQDFRPTTWMERHYEGFLSVNCRTNTIFASTSGLTSWKVSRRQDITLFLHSDVSLVVSTPHCFLNDFWYPFYDFFWSKNTIIMGSKSNLCVSLGLLIFLSVSITNILKSNAWKKTG